jgi:hypothetical protein
MSGLVQRIASDPSEEVAGRAGTPKRLADALFSTAVARR